jgi:hypothetical protein
VFFHFISFDFVQGLPHDNVTTLFLQLGDVRYGCRLSNRHDAANVHQASPTQASGAFRQSLAHGMGGV